MTGTRRAWDEGPSVSGARRWVADGALLSLALVGAVSVCRMVEGGLGGAADVPVLVTAAAGCVVGALVSRRVQRPLAAALGAVTVALVTVWTVVPRATRDGVPTSTTVRVLHVDIRAALADLSGFRPPLHASPGVVVLAALVAGMAAVAGRVTFGDMATRSRRFPAGAVVFNAALVTWSVVAAPSAGDALLVAALIAVGAVVVAVATPAPAATASTASGPGAGRPPVRRRLVASPATVALMAIVVAVAIGVPATAAPGGASGLTPGPAIAARVPATGLSLASDLLGLERRDPSVVLFWARSPVPTYWQVGILSTYRDGAWTPDPSTSAALAGTTGPTTAPVLPTSPAHTFIVAVTVRDLSSRLLPVPPDTTSVDAPGGAAVTAVGAVAAVASALDERYQATAIVPPAVSAATTTTGGLGAAQLAPYLATATVPAVINDLARQVTSTAATPLGRAEALVDWFRSGLFRYTLTPPPIPTGRDPLVAFLTDTRAGTCESFAGAFAVMARSGRSPHPYRRGVHGRTRHLGGDDHRAGRRRPRMARGVPGSGAGMGFVRAHTPASVGGVVPAERDRADRHRAPHHDPSHRQLGAGCALHGAHRACRHHAARHHGSFVTSGSLVLVSGTVAARGVGGGGPRGGRPGAVPVAPSGASQRGDEFPAGAVGVPASRAGAAPGRPRPTGMAFAACACPGPGGRRPRGTRCLDVRRAHRGDR